MNRCDSSSGTITKDNTAARMGINVTIAIKAARAMLQNISLIGVVGDIRGPAHEDFLIVLISLALSVLILWI